jgi:D-alanyl-D-alanine carboxypeptidase
MFDSRAVSALSQMVEDAASAGYPMYITSTHRSISYQDGLYQKKVNEYLMQGYNRPKAEEEAAKWVAIPGTSEHNLGLAADIVSAGWYAEHGDLEQTFENTEHFKWLYENCADYGFILRYPKGKEDVTGIVYEPWHYRYVGVDIARYIMNNELTLEEFLAL